MKTSAKHFSLAVGP